MPDISGPFDGLPWNMAEWYRDAYARTGSGVCGSGGVAASAGDLALTVNGLTVSVGLGRAHVRGAGYERTGTPWSHAVDANTNTTLARRDRIVLRRDLAAKTVTPLRLQGIPAASPLAPPLVEDDNGVCDEPLFSFTVPPNGSTTLTGITDERRWLDPAGVRRGSTKVLSAGGLVPANTDGKVDLWNAAAQHDTAGAWDGVNKRLVIPWAGFWRVQAKVHLTGGATGAQLHVRFAKVITSPPTQVYANDAAVFPDPYVDLAFEDSFAAGDVILTQFWTPNTGITWSASLYGAATYLYLEYLRPRP